jgi:hypothetical protein
MHMHTCMPRTLAYNVRTRCYAFVHDAFADTHAMLMYYCEHLDTCELWNTVNTVDLIELQGSIETYVEI